LPYCLLLPVCWKAHQRSRLIYVIDGFAHVFPHVDTPTVVLVDARQQERQGRQGGIDSRMRVRGFGYVVQIDNVVWQPNFSRNVFVPEACVMCTRIPDKSQVEQETLEGALVAAVVFAD
jgi:hypothetical protein